VLEELMQIKKNRHGWRFYHFAFGVMRCAYYTLRAKNAKKKYQSEYQNA
jgi:hypothetical protein